MADSTCLTEKKVAGQDYSDSSRRSSIRKDSRDDEVVCDVKHDSDDDLELEQVASEVAIVQHDANDFPDGGLRAWLVVFGTMCNTFSTFGYVNAWGVFQAYYETTLLKDQTPSTIAWICSIQYALVFMPGLITGRLFDLGYFRMPLFIASCILVISTFLIAECTQYWQFLLCQGFAVGLSSGVIFGPTMGIISHWFNKRRGIALGLMATGTSIGGAVFPIAADKLIKEVGFKWTMRILGFVLIVTLGCANLTLQRRLPPSKVSGGIVNPKIFKNPAYSTFIVSVLLAFLGLYTVLTYINVSSNFAGINPNFSFYLVSIVNASSGLGRILAGALADRFGAINMMAPFTLLAAAMTYYWPYARTEGSISAVAVIYGASSGAYISLIAIPVIAYGEMQDVGRRVGMCMTFLAFGALFGPPISAAINQSTGNFNAVGLYAGSMVVASVILLLISRQIHLGRFWGKF